MEKYCRYVAKSFLLIVAMATVLNGSYKCCPWVNLNDGIVRPIAAAWMMMSGVITAIREFRRGYHPFWLAIAEFTLCLAGVIGVMNSLALFYYGYAYVPSAGTMLGFAVFWAVHILLQIARFHYLKHLYLLVVLIGTIGLIGHWSNSEVLQYQFVEDSNAITITSAVFLIVLGLAAYSREREGP